jgi:transcriptional regulator with XRE-family HTH domain/tetratricopeptide (TPR) repeat protein
LLTGEKMAIPNEKLVAARLQKRWSIAVASEKAGVSINTFNRWERGLQIPQLGTLDQVCNAFGLSPDELGFEQVISDRRRKKPQLTEVPVRCTPIPQPMQMASQQPILTDCSYSAVAIQPQTHTLHACIEQARRSFGSMDLTRHKHEYEEGFSRRRAIATLIGTPAAILGIAPGMNLVQFHPEEVLELCNNNIPLAWKMYFDGGLAEADLHLHSYLPQLTSLTQQVSPYQKRAAALASQGNQLASLIALQHQNFGIAHQRAQDAFTYGALAEDHNLQTASLIRQAQVFLYLKRPVSRLQAYERALAYLPHTSPLLQARVYIGLTETYGHLGDNRQAAHYQDLALTVFPDQFTADPNFYYTHFNHWSIAALEGMMYLHLEQPEQSWVVFSRMENLVPLTPVPNRVELTVRQAKTASAMNNRDLACTYVEAAATLALAANNQLRFDEAYTVYRDIQSKWGSDQQVKELADLFY